MEEEAGISLHSPQSFSNINPQSSLSLEEWSSTTRLGEKEILKQGWILKWGNFIKGYDQRWLVLYPDRLVYYKHDDSKSRFRGSIGLQDADIQKEDHFGFTVTNREDISFKFKAENEFEQHNWISAIEFAKARLASKRDSSEIEEADEHQTFSYRDQAAVEEVVQILDDKLSNLKIFNDNFILQSENLNWTLISLMKMSKSNKEFDAIESFRDQSPQFLSACTEILDTANDFLKYAQLQEAKWKKMLANNLEHKVVLEDMVEQMATQQSQLENLAKSNAYKDIYSTGESLFHANREHLIPNRTSSEVKGDLDTYHSNKSLKECFSKEAVNEKLSVEQIRQRRCKIPYKSHRFHIKLWAIIRNSIYRDIIRLSLPVYFNEPLTMNQRLTEMFENAFLLDKAASTSDTFEQMTYVSAFVIASYSAHPFRATKPFIPFLGETYECDRQCDLHWRCLTECVSSEPLTIVQHCEGKEWEMHQEFYISSKFKGQTVEVYPKGMSFLKIRSSFGEQEYCWERLTTVIHNVIIGQMWITHLGKIQIQNRATEDKAIIKFQQSRCTKKSFSFKILGMVKDQAGNLRWMMNGVWDTRIEAARVLPSTDAAVEDDGVVKTCMPVVLWEKDCLENSCRMFYFGLLACQMNEPESDVAPTDSRLRADVRLLEQGRSEGSMRLKQRLRITNQKRRPDHLPTWFALESPSPANAPAYQYTGAYWSCKKKSDWSACPSIVLSL